MPGLEVLLDPPATTGLLALADAEARFSRATATVGAERVELGHSRAGRPLTLHRLGSGERRSFWYAGPHANEPVGVSTIVELAERLAARPEVLRGDIGFDLLLCLDPDSYVLNENWFGPEIDPGTYYRGLYRPAMNEFPDWDFPVEYGTPPATLRRESTLPEGRALRAGVDLSRPLVLNALHNAELGGVHFCVLGERGGLAARLSALPRRFGLPREEAMLDDPEALPLAAGVFPIPDLTGVYGTVPASGHDDPVGHLLGGSAAAWCGRYGTVSMVPEIPYWSVAEERPAGAATMGDLARATGRELAAFADWLAGFVRAHPAALPTGDPRARATLDAPARLAGLAAAFIAWADTDAARTLGTPDAAARYEVMLSVCLPLRYRGMLLAAVTAAGAPATTIGLAEEAFEAGMAALAKTPLTAHPLPTLVDIQLAAGVLATDCAAAAA